MIASTPVTTKSGSLVVSRTKSTVNSWPGAGVVVEGTKDKYDWGIVMTAARGAMFWTCWETKMATGKAISKMRPANRLIFCLPPKAIDKLSKDLFGGSVKI